MLNPLWWLVAAAIAFLSKGRITFWQALSRLLLGMGAVVLVILAAPVLLGALDTYMNMLSGDPDGLDQQEVLDQQIPWDEDDPCTQDILDGVPDEYSRCAAATAMPTRRPPAMPQNTAQLYVTANALIVRDGPGSEYAIVGYLSQCDVVTAPTGGGDWLHVQTPVGAGYVVRKYISTAADC